MAQETSDIDAGEDDYDSVQVKFAALKRAVQAQVSAWREQSALARLAALKSLSEFSRSLVKRVRARADKLAEPLRRPSAVSLLKTQVTDLQTRLEKLEDLVRANSAATNSAVANQAASRFPSALPNQPPARASLASNASSTSASASATSSSHSLNQDPAYAKYRRMLSFGVPRSAVDQAMTKDGVDPKGLDGAAAAPAAGPGGDAATKSGMSTAGLPKRAPAFSASALQQVRLRTAKASASDKSSAKTPQRASRGVITLQDLQGVKLKSTPLKKASSSSSSSLAAKTPQRAARGVVTLADLQGVKLRATPQRSKAPPRARGNTPGAILSLEQLQQVKLRPSTPSVVDKENCKNSSNKKVSFRLRKTTIDRSPGGTPSKAMQSRPGGSRHVLRTPLQERSPSRARSDGEFLELALRRKFASLHAMRQSSPQQWSPGTNSSFLV
ncbi:Proline-rich protein 11 [Hondaea fermentalgiana]|uniref:Proline-rich protein 11 n=1 Tax=Hondaea fermentalgiana TaxID=2315210 RepID=A0A2R5G7T0_9STRA|nr:Proline-rich protein 11 [Hondaea fermentalgiana]|eukprot:GBG24091.1 Proline-rich protein 11 [Hondaea fermentalgiana]